MGGLLARFAGFFKRKDPRTPVKGIGTRVHNLFAVHYKGLIGVFVPLVLLSWQPRRYEYDITVGCLWFLMFWSFLLQPVSVPVVGFIPLFLLPMSGAMSTPDTCTCYFDDNTVLLLLGGMIHLMLNSCGVDRRIILWFLCSGDGCQFSGKRIVLKASAAAFFMSMFSNKLIVTSTIVQYLTPAYTSLQSSTSSSRGTEPDYDAMRYIVLCAVQTASSIGSITIVHASVATMAMRIIWCRHPPKGSEYPDIFNYMQYTCFAFPVAFSMFIFNFVYHMFLINNVVGKPMSGSSMNQLRNSLLEQKKALPPDMSGYQKANIFFYLLYVLLCMFRWCDWLGSMGWTGSQAYVERVLPKIKDATIASIFVIVLHIMPKSFGFLRYLSAKTKSDLIMKPDSPFMLWRFVDKNTNYGYVFLIGSGVALNVAVRVTKLGEKIASNYGKHITDLPWAKSLAVVTVISSLLPNIMSGVAAVCIILPFVLNMVGLQESKLDDPPVEPSIWEKNVYLGALGVGVAGSFGFALPLLYTPAYFCHYTGKVPISKMMKYSSGSLLICMGVLWLALCYWGPIIWVSKSVGLKTYTLIAATTTAEGPPPPQSGL